MSGRGGAFKIGFVFAFFAVKALNRKNREGFRKVRKKMQALGILPKWQHLMQPQGECQHPNR